VIGFLRRSIAYHDPDPGIYSKDIYSRLYYVRLIHQVVALVSAEVCAVPIYLQQQTQVHNAINALKMYDDAAES